MCPNFTMYYTDVSHSTVFAVSTKSTYFCLILAGCASGHQLNLSLKILLPNELHKVNGKYVIFLFSEVFLPVPFCIALWDKSIHQQYAYFETTFACRLIASI